MKIKQICSKLLSLKKSDYIVLALMGILILIVAIPTGGAEKKEKNDSEIAYEDQSRSENENYGKELEKQLKDILEKIDGVGKAEVMITLEDDGSAKLDKDIKKSMEYTQTNTVIYDDDDKTKPYVTSMEKPKVKGVLVVAQGGGNASVDSNISQAVQALFDVEVHKITIAKMLSED